MGASAELYAQRMRGPEPDEGDQYVMEQTRVMRAKHERHVVRAQRVLDALRVTDELDGEVAYVG